MRSFLFAFPAGSDLVEQLPYVHILSPGGCPFVNVSGLDLHGAGLVPDRLRAQRAYEPDRLALDEALYVLLAE